MLLFIFQVADSHFLLNYFSYYPKYVSPYQQFYLERYLSILLAKFKCFYYFLLF